MSLYTNFVRPLLFRLNPESAHRVAILGCRVAGRIPGGPQIASALWDAPCRELRTEVAGLRFENPVGLAAGWDKSGETLRMLGHLGFGFAEIGSISARPSAGNPRPRLFRLPVDDAIVVNYGLPNDGAEAVARRLDAVQLRIPLGVNVVTTNDGPDAPPCSESEILADYRQSVSRVHRRASYLMLNLSCPNAEGGKDHFAGVGTIRRLLQCLAEEPIACPVFLKVAPDPDPRALERLVEEAEPFSFVHGFMFNLAPGKPVAIQLRSPRSRVKTMPGAVAGRPVAPLINRCIGELYRRLPRKRFAIIGAGGIFSAEDAYEKIRLGASLVQLYTALVYEGPGVVKRINRELCRLLEHDGFQSVGEAVGTHPSLRPPFSPG